MAEDQSKIAKCTCKHEQQDKIYGTGLRVHNPAFAKGAKKGNYRCAVCRTERGIADRPQ